jgi:hypothetical protein
MPCRRNNGIPNSLHNTQAGYWTAINTRNGNVPEDHAKLQEMFGNHCATCHTTCGECHVSQPENVGGGLFTGHVFESTPPMTRSCTACHGSRVGNEFLGKNEGVPGDVHFREARMSCVKCHESAELHGMTEGTASADHRLNGAEDPKCIDCHEEVCRWRWNFHAQTAWRYPVLPGLSLRDVHKLRRLSCGGK